MFDVLLLPLQNLNSAQKKRWLHSNQISFIYRRSRLDSLDLNIPPPGLASFQDLYSALLTQYEAVSFGDRLFGCWVLLPLQRRYSVTMRLAVFGEHVGILRSLGVTLEQVMMKMPVSFITQIFYCLIKHSLIISLSVKALRPYRAVHISP